MYMNIVIYGISVFIIICLLLIWYVNTFNKFQELIIRINESESSIDSILRKRFDLLNRSIGIIKANTNTKEDVLDDIVKLRSRKLTNYELDRKLYDSLNEFDRIKEKHPKLTDSDAFIKIELGLTESEAEITACRKYYNDIITDYNKLSRTFPSNIVAKICHYKNKTYFDGKDMDDDIKNDMKL